MQCLIYNVNCAQCAEKSTIEPFSLSQFVSAMP